MKHSEQINELVAAMVKAQAVMPTPKFDGRVKYEGRDFGYASLSAIIDTVRKPLTDVGLWFTQTTETNESGIVLSTTLLHTSGQWILSESPIVSLRPGAQAYGSALTYGKRYALCAILGISAEEDDDGNAGDGKSAKTEPRTFQKAAAPQPKVIPGDETPRLSDEQLPDAIIAAEADLERDGVLTPEQIVKARLKYGGGKASVESMSGIGRRSYLSKLKEQLKVN